MHKEETKAMEDLSILIVDDEKPLYEVMREYLKTIFNFKRIMYAQDGSAGSFMVNNEPFDLIIVDLEMPKKGGLEFLRSIKSHEHVKESRYIIVSGKITKGRILEGIDVGVKNFLAKPFTKEEFVNRVKKVLDM